MLFSSGWWAERMRSWRFPFPLMRTSSPLAAQVEARYMIAAVPTLGRVASPRGSRQSVGIGRTSIVRDMASGGCRLQDWHTGPRVAFSAELRQSVVIDLLPRTENQGVSLDPVEILSHFQVEGDKT